jgi:hypothetical protein
MACLLGVQQSFARAELALAEVAGWEMDGNTLRQLCHATAQQASAGRADRATAEAFAQAPGDTELQIDAGKANTREGWRDVKVGVFARRERGAPTTAAQGGPARPAGASGAFRGGRRGGGERLRRALRGGSGAVGADRPAGAERAGRRCGVGVEPGPAALRRVRRTAGHLARAEHLADGAKAACGPGSAEAQAQARRGKQRLLQDG